MSYLVIHHQERARSVLDTDDEVSRACGTFIAHGIVMAWCARSSVGDVLRDAGIGRGRVAVIKLGEMTDVADIAAQLEASERLRDATDAVGDAVDALRGRSS